MHKFMRKWVFKRTITMMLTLVMLMGSVPFLGVSSAELNYDLPWLWPVPGSYKLNSLDYYYGGGLHNYGQCMDIGANGYTGTNRLDVISATNGTVLYIQDKYNETTNRGSGWGNYVIVRSGNINIVYGHLQTISCGYGQIRAGDVIGKMGNTGNSTGVHLHLQAYPSTENAASTAIPVFEQYKTNPLYFEKFQFMKGLKNTSIRYGEWISAYYTNTSGSYYTYSGGLSLDYAIVPSYALVTIINANGATVRSEPLLDNAYNLDTIKTGTTVSIMGHYTDAMGSSWLLLGEDTTSRTWILADDVGFHDYRFQTELLDPVAPEGTFGAFWDLVFSGTLLSRNQIHSVTATIMQGAKTVAAYTKEVNTTKYTIDGTIKSGLALDELPDGTYTYTLTASETATYPGADSLTKDTVLITSTFSIDSTLSDRIPPLLEAIRITSLTPTVITMSCLATDNKLMDHVTITLSSEDNSFAKTFIITSDTNSYDLSLAVSELAGAGNYTITAVARDAYGNTDTLERTIIVPSAELSEIWIVGDTLRVRSGPGTSYSRVTTLSKGTVITITEVVAAEGYIWGKIANGWCALDYCSYSGGALYTVSFDLNGGKGEMLPSVLKQYGIGVTVPATVPTREGYTFLGWALSSDAKQSAYDPGSSYVANASCTLFAVWEDAVYPTITDIFQSPDTWTNGTVTIMVQASDNTDLVFYSFDGGLSWLAEGKWAVNENTVLPSQQIAVKDSSGNITYFSEAFVVDNIDRCPPDMTLLETIVAIDGNQVSFTFTGIVDEESGLSTYALTLSDSPDLDNSFTIAVRPGQAISMEDGVYYGKLTVTDAAGNASEKTLQRFCVGPAVPLTSPKGVETVRTDTTSAELSWNIVLHADSYLVSYSTQPDFRDAVEIRTDNAHVSISELLPGISYYCRVSAQASDGIYLPSEWSQSLLFVTLSDDATIHSLSSMTDAVIDSKCNTITWEAPYEANTVNLSAVVARNATVSYWYDEALTVEITSSGITSYPFYGSEITAYLCVTAENGKRQVYTLSVTRAAQAAAPPTVHYVPKNQSILVGEIPEQLSLEASASDGGTITVTWYQIDEMGQTSIIGEGLTLSPICEKAGKYVIFAVVTNRNLKCEKTTATFTTDPVTIQISKHQAMLNIILHDYVYNGSSPSIAVSGYLGDGIITYRFFSDVACTLEIDPPVNAGTYYVIAYATETDTYLSGISQSVAFNILKMDNYDVPSLSVVQPTLRDSNGYITVLTENVEFRFDANDANDTWNSIAKGTILPIPEPQTAEFRVKETKNQKAGAPITVTIHAFEGTQDIIPNESMGFTVDGEYLLVNGSSITADMLLSGLVMQEGITIYSSQGTLLNGTQEFVGTGSHIAIEDDLGVFKSLCVLVLGDLDGNGVVTREDVYQILYLSNGMAISEKEYDLLAGDINHDGVLTAADAYLANGRI